MLRTKAESDRGNARTHVESCRSTLGRVFS